MVSIKTIYNFVKSTQGYKHKMYINVTKSAFSSIYNIRLYNKLLFENIQFKSNYYFIIKNSGLYRLIALSQLHYNTKIL